MGLRSSAWGTENTAEFMAPKLRAALLSRQPSKQGENLSNPARPPTIPKPFPIGNLPKVTMPSKTRYSATSHPLIRSLKENSMPKLLEKYSRQVLFPEIGEKGQARLIQSKVVILGCGALGTVQADALCRAGTGSLRIVDRDFLEESNLQRQTLFCEEDVQDGLPKPAAAERRLRQINSQVRLDASG